MKCPACFHDLFEISVGSLRVDACHGGCGGIWLDAFELGSVDETNEPAEPLLCLTRDETLVIDTQRKRECPRCRGIKLHRHFFSARRQVQVDQCPNCAGYWLDAGELQQIRAENELSSISARAGEATISSEFIRYLYRLKSRPLTPEPGTKGEDYPS